MDILRRASGPVLLLGGAAILVSVPLGLATGIVGAKELPWLSVGGVFVAAAAYVRSHRPDEVITWWFATVGGLFGMIQGLDGLLAILSEAPGPGGLLALASLGYHLGAVAAVVAVAHLIGLFPDGEATHPERRALRALTLLFAAPPLAAVTSPDVVLPYYHPTAPVENPYHLAALSWLQPVTDLGLTLVPTAFLVGAGLLVLRYRRGGGGTRRRIRWLLLPVLFAGFAALVDATSVIAAPAVPRLVVDVLWLGSLVALPLSITIAVLRPALLDVDRILRRSLVYGSLWTLIAVVYVTAAATLGMAAGQRFDVGVAIVLTVAATLVFQPARVRLQGLADRWVFGPRADPARLVARLGATLAQTFDLETLLPHIAETLRQGSVRDGSSSASRPGRAGWRRKVAPGDRTERLSSRS